MSREVCEHGRPIWPPCVDCLMNPPFRPLIANMDRHIADLEANATCACGDLFNPKHPGICPNCLEAKIADLEAQLAEAREALEGLYVTVFRTLMPGASMESAQARIAKLPTRDIRKAMLCAHAALENKS